MNPLKTAVQLACIDIYAPSSFGSFKNILHNGDTLCAIAVIDNQCFVVNQGTIDLAGWQADFTIEPIKHQILGQLHRGFYDNLHFLAKKILKLIPQDMRVICAGHSKGAGEAAILSALLKLSGVNVVRNYLFACPNPGFKELSIWLQANIPGTSYRNKCCLVGDPVPEVPLNPYWPPYEHTIITNYPKTWKMIFPTEWHNAKLYYEAINRIANKNK